MIVIFEDREAVNNLKPFSLVRPVQDIKCGFFTVVERVSKIYNANVKLLTRREISFFYPEYLLLKDQDLVNEDDVIFSNASFLLPEEDFKNLESQILVYKGRIIQIHTKVKDIKNLDMLLSAVYENDLDKVKDSFKVSLEVVEKKEVKCFINYPWDIINLNKFLMLKDFELLVKEFPRSNQTVELEGGSDLLLISPKSKVSKGVFVDTTDGPVVIDDGAKVLPLTVITGPSYIGKGSVVSQARIREGTNIRDVCKVSGEVEESIIDSYSNKNHEGFLGHSYVGQWVNIGAMATNSDLKNTYDEVKVFVEPRKVVSTGMIKVGCFIGDLSKIGIGVLINTGTMIGIGANIFFEGELIRKYVPNFAWGGKEPYKKFPFDRLINTSKTMFSRRNKEFPKFLEDILKNLYNSE
ncbi:MAG: putative sugar nucleotidyl transferase [Brevinematia bacterium]